MRIWFRKWVEEEYIRLILLADQLLGKEKLVDFYHTKALPKREQAPVLAHNLIPNLEELLKSAQQKLDDTAPFYPKTVFTQQISAFKTYLENEVSSEKLDYAQAIESLLGVKLTEPDWQKHRQRLEDSLKAAGYSGSASQMLKKWRQEGTIDVFTFMHTAKELIPQLWEEVNNKFLTMLLSDGEIDFLQGSSEIKFFYLDNLWEDWPYYGNYHHNYMTMIALNARLGWNKFEAKAFLAHEVLPGRHLLWILRQRLHDLGQLPKVSMLCTFASPERLVQEGMIACAHEFLWPEGANDPKEQIALDHWRLQQAVGLMAAIKLCRDKEPPKQVQHFVQEQALLLPGRAKALLQIIQEHPYHYPSKQLGYELVRKLWQTYGEDFWLGFSQYRCPAVLQKLYPLPASKKRRKKLAS